MDPTIGRIVHYRISDDDEAAINRRRTHFHRMRDEMQGEKPGVQVHIGNRVTAGDIVPLVVTRIFANPKEGGPALVNGQVLLDGSDSLWVTSAGQGSQPGMWDWPNISAEPDRATRRPSGAAKGGTDGIKA